jgi:hypothetical protein
MWKAMLLLCGIAISTTSLAGNDLGVLGEKLEN